MRGPLRRCSTWVTAPAGFSSYDFLNSLLQKSPIAHQKDCRKISNWWLIIYFLWNPTCCCGAGLKIIIFLQPVSPCCGSSLQLKSLLTSRIRSGQQPWSSAAVTPVIDHQLGRAEPHTSQHLAASRSHRTPTCLSLQPPVSFQTPPHSRRPQGDGGWKFL